MLRMVGLEPPSGLGSCELAVVQLFCEQGAGREEIIAHQHERDGRVFIPGPRTRHSHHVHKRKRDSQSIRHAEVIIYNTDGLFL